MKFLKIFLPTFLIILILTYIGMSISIGNLNLIQWTNIEKMCFILFSIANILFSISKIFLQIR